MNPKVFPYGNTQENMEKKFEVMTTDYNSYVAYLKEYKSLISQMEQTTKAMNKEAAINFPMQATYQKWTALMANETTRLIWLRRSGRAWRFRSILMRHYGLVEEGVRNSLAA
jgi:hypothetical protein